MDVIDHILRRKRAYSALLLMFFVSGATGLVYQTIWSRHLHLVFGTSTFAIATVLSTFMLGLALGGIAMGWWADRSLRPLETYGLMEIGIGLFALAFPTLLDGVAPIYRSLYASMDAGPVTYGLLQCALVGSLLVVPTALMGATLPLLARFATARMGEAGERVGTLYAVNTMGAVVGIWVAGFVCLPWWGLSFTTGLAAAANIGLGICAIVIGRGVRASGMGELPVEADVAPPLSGQWKPVWVAMFLAGFASLVYEVAWTRVMGLMVGASVYAFSVMLLAFLVGIALGGRLGAGWSDRLFAAGGRGRVLLALAGVETGVAVLSCGLMYVYPELPFWYVWMVDALPGGSEWAQGTWMVSLVLSGLIMTPPAVLMGLAFPLAVRSVVGEDGRLSAPVGYLYGVNTLGGVLGAFLAGFVMLPGIQVQGTIFVAAACNLLATAVLLSTAEVRALAGRASTLPRAALGIALFGLMLLVQRPPWDPMLMTAGMYHYIEHFDDHSRQGILDYAVGKYELIFYEEGLSTVVTVAKNRDSGNMWLANNGKIDASTSTDMPTQVLCAILPAQFVEAPDDVLVIGLASGITAGALTLIPDIERLDIVEIEPAIERAARIFSEHNHEVLDDPRVNLMPNDGRNHLLLTEEGTYDLIVSEPSNPWITGVSNLFTREFWEMGKRRLKDGGVWSQWIQMYGMDDDDLLSLLRTFSTVYDHVVVYATIEDADLVLVGSDHPITAGPEAASRLLTWSPELTAQLDEVDVNEALDIVSMLQLTRDDIMDMTERAVLNTDDNMRIEYRAPKHLHIETSWNNMRRMMKHTSVPFAVLPEDPMLYADLARIYQSRDDVTRAWNAMAAAIASLPLQHPVREEWKQELVEWQTEGDEPEDALDERAEDPLAVEQGL